MKIKIDYISPISLISQLKKLYFKISSKILKNRLKSYHSNTVNNSTYSIKKLTDKINKIQIKNELNNHILTKEKTAKDSTLNSNVNKTRQYQAFVASHALKGLSIHLNSKTMKNEINPMLSEKLEKSIWQHIHNAIRYARQDNSAYAEVNANIANNALKEIAHYMTNEQYNQFCNKIEQELQHCEP